MISMSSARLRLQRVYQQQGCVEGAQHAFSVSGELQRLGRTEGATDEVYVSGCPRLERRYQWLGCNVGARHAFYVFRTLMPSAGCVVGPKMPCMFQDVHAVIGDISGYEVSWVPSMISMSLVRLCLQRISTDISAAESSRVPSMRPVFQGTSAAGMGRSCNA